MDPPTKNPNLPNLFANLFLSRDFSLKPRKVGTKRKKKRSGQERGKKKRQKRIDKGRGEEK